MAERFLVVLSQVATLFMLMGVGYALAKVSKISPAGTWEMSGLLMAVAIPCAIINGFPKEWDLGTLGMLGMAAVAVAVSYLLGVLVTLPLFRKEGSSLRAPLRFGSMYGNVGFMGLPLVAAVVGQEALVFVSITIIVCNVFAFTHGAMLMGGREAVSVKKILLNPAIVGSFIGFALFLLRVELPGPVQSTVNHIANLNTPLAMMVIGAQMSRADLLRTFRESKLYLAAAVKLLAMPLLTAAVLLPLGLDRTCYLTLVILAGTPAAGLTSMFAEQYDRDTARAAQLVSFSHLLSALTLPVMAVLAETLAG